MSDRDDRPKGSLVDPSPQAPNDGKEPWVRPEITTYLPANTAAGISYHPLDGLSNRTS